MNGFEPRIAELLEYLQPEMRRGKNAPPRPFMVEILGTQRSGKTSSIRELDKLFRKERMNVFAPQEGAQTIRHIERSDSVYNPRTMIDALTILIDECAGHNHDLVIFDRCLYDAYAFMYYAHAVGRINEQEMRMLQAFISWERWLGDIDAACLMVCDPEVAMQREMRVALSRKTLASTNTDTIRLLMQAYNQTYVDLAPTHPQLKLIDTTEMNEKQGVQAVAEHVLSCLTKKMQKEKEATK